MKLLKVSFAVLATLFSLAVFAQKDYPEQNVEYKSSWQEDYRGEGYITYSYYLENIGSEPLIFYNFKVTPNTERYEFLQPYPSDILIIYPYQKTSYVQVKVYTNGPALTWNSKFMRVKDESSSYPQQNRDYVYYWRSENKSDEMTTYSYHLKNISARNIKFYDFTLTNNGGIYYLVDNLQQKPVYTKPGESLQIVKYNFKSGETPSVNWYADWATFAPSGDVFCTGLNKVMDGAKDEGFSSIKGALKQAANDSDTFFDTYYCKEHIDGVNNEVIEDLLFFWQYKGTIGSPAPLDVINSRFYEYKAKVESCLPDFPEKEQASDYSGYLKAEYEAEVDYLMHYLRLQVEYDISSSNYRLDIVVEEVY